jgi:Protein of unknown function (DUF3037)
VRQLEQRKRIAVRFRDDPFSHTRVKSARYDRGKKGRDALVRVSDGAPGAGPIALLAPSERFGWLAARSSTIVQPSDVHAGLCCDPVGTLNALYDRLVEFPVSSEG